MRNFVSSRIEITLDEAYEKALAAFEAGDPTSKGSFSQYLGNFYRKIEGFRILDFQGDIDDEIVRTIDAFLPLRNQYVRLLISCARHNPNAPWIVPVHRFIEKLQHYTSPPRWLEKRVEYDLDNFKFFVHEIFLYTIAVLLKFERFEEAAYLLSNRYYVVQGKDHGFMAGFDDIHKHMGSLESRNKRLAIGTEAIRADMLKARCCGTVITLNDLMQADFTIFLRAELENFPEYSRWWPELITFLDSEGGSFEIYVRARSEEYFNHLKEVLGILEPKDLQALVDAYKEEKREAPRGMKPRTISKLIGYDFLLMTTTTP